MSIPCQAKCSNQVGGACQLNDERIEQSRVEFGAEWSPVSDCACYSPPRRQEKSKKAKQQNKKK